MKRSISTLAPQRPHVAHLCNAALDRAPASQPVPHHHHRCHRRRDRKQKSLEKGPSLSAETDGGACRGPSDVQGLGQGSETLYLSVPRPYKQSSGGGGESQVGGDHPPTSALTLGPPASHGDQVWAGGLSPHLALCADFTSFRPAPSSAAGPGPPPGEGPTGCRRERRQERGRSQERRQPSSSSSEKQRFYSCDRFGGREPSHPKPSLSSHPTSPTAGQEPVPPRPVRQDPLAAPPYATPPPHPVPNPPSCPGSLARVCTPPFLAPRLPAQPRPPVPTALDWPLVSPLPELCLSLCHPPFPAPLPPPHTRPVSLLAASLSPRLTAPPPSGSHRTGLWSGTFIFVFFCPVLLSCRVVVQ